MHEVLRWLLAGKIAKSNRFGLGKTLKYILGEVNALYFPLYICKVSCLTNRIKGDGQHEKIYQQNLQRTAAVSKLKNWGPSKTQRSGFAGERRGSRMSKPCRFRQGEGYGACDDKVKVLGVSPSNVYELMHDPDFSVLCVGSRMVMPKEQFIQWVVEHTE